ncbi:MAG: hypothetical protein GWO40_04610 [Gammaproteobacteria bacterium]|nr:hypothetical protein [Gammaproteobacteria bacterium]NIV50932.1 hypothetical protein [Gammaproteobacteria bacterium]NIX84842.1 hypothetical protein [Gammaproteobacteria bacterium]
MDKIELLQARITAKLETVRMLRRQIARDHETIRRSLRECLKLQAELDEAQREYYAQAARGGTDGDQ